MVAVVIGAGPAGLAAAAFLKRGEADKIIVLEKNEKTGKKLYITGKGRCNVTNDCDARDFLKNVVSNPKFLSSAITGFPPSSTVELLTDEGVRLKTERGNRVFPESDKSSDIIKSLTNLAIKNGAEIILNRTVTGVDKDENGFTVRCLNAESVKCDICIVATGGITYGATGSTGDGYKFAKVFGHNIIKPIPALSPLVLNESVKDLEGLSLKNVKIKIGGYAPKDAGEMLFTGSGVSGPLILTASSYINRLPFPQKLTIDLKPALSMEVLDKRILSDFEKYSSKQIKNALDDLLPKTLIPYIIDYCKVPKDTPINSVTKQMRAALLSAIKGLEFTINSLGDTDGAIITAGGVDTKQINPKTMESKLISGLYFAGEVLDVDAVTGGFNIQIALSTGAAAGRAGGNLCLND